MNTDNDPPRLAVVAAIIDDGGADGPVTSAARRGGAFPEGEGAAMASSATQQERALAEALQETEQTDKPAASGPAVADLLMLADDGADADKLATGLSQTFLIPDDSLPAIPKQDRRSAFADIYRQLALHQLDSQVRNKAAAVLRTLRRQSKVNADGRS